MRFLPGKGILIKARRPVGEVEQRKFEAQCERALRVFIAIIARNEGSMGSMRLLPESLNTFFNCGGKSVHGGCLHSCSVCIAASSSVLRVL
jgi:hypothetical protein